MIITKSWIKKRRPCSGGYGWFCRTFPKGCDLQKPEHVDRFLMHSVKEDQYPRHLRREWLCDVLVVLAAGVDFPASRNTFRSWPDKVLAKPLVQALMAYFERDSYASLFTELFWLPDKRLVKAARQIHNAAFGPTCAR